MDNLQLIVAVYRIHVTIQRQRDNFIPKWSNLSKEDKQEIINTPANNSPYKEMSDGLYRAIIEELNE